MALSATGHEDTEWQPPSEAELKVIQARRERQDKISKLMSDYLLKGYRMLGECCDDCGTILLQDKQKQLYCVTCQELNSDVDKDNPALNAQAALSQVREHQLAANTDEMVSRPEHCEGAALGLRSSAPDLALPVPRASPNAALARSTLAAAEGVILQKIEWATRHLQETISLERSIQLCTLIHSCTEALKSIRDLPQ
ncbi:protein ZNRD2-like isoform X3 [Erythrolamprus reginae]|uniref:protein ZNRD2-like isoform X3 n=1 Tax=Erythrolamprus reginae TaxID=121349 RepID=UPI00396D0065